MKNTQYIGFEVNRLRKNAGMTLKELGDATNLSQGFLSKFERGLTTIAVDSLMQIALVLGTTLDHLLSNEYTESDDKQVKVVHRSYEDSVMYIENNFVHYQISDNYEDMDMFPRKTVLLPTQASDHNALFSHHGQEFVYVLEGILTLKIGNDIYDLFPGDTAQFKSNVEHTWYNNTSKNTVILTMHTPNIFIHENSDVKIVKENNGIMPR